MDDKFRLIVSLITAGAAGASLFREEMTDEQKKGVVWASVAVGVCTYAFIEAVLIVAALVAVLFAACKLGPRIMEWVLQAKCEVEGRKWEGNGRIDHTSVPLLPYLDELEQAADGGASKEELVDQIKWLKTNGKGNSNAGRKK